jgi:hypothetical protein
VLLKPGEHKLRALVACVGKEGNPLRAGGYLAQQLDPLGADVACNDGKPGDVAARAREARHQSDPDGIGEPGDHDWNGRGSPLDCERRRRARDHNDGGPKRDDFGRKRREPFRDAVGVASVHTQVLALSVSQLRQSLQKCPPDLTARIFRGVVQDRNP